MAAVIGVLVRFALSRSSRKHRSTIR